MNHMQARQQAIQQAQQLLAQEPIYLDTETTGVRSDAEIVEISIVDHNGHVLLDTLVRPRGPIPADAERIHGISDSMVADARNWGQLWPEIEALVVGRPIGIYNAAFDLRLIEQSQRFANLPHLAMPLNSFCIMKLYAKFVGEWDQYRQNYRWQSLEKAQRQCNIALTNTHRAKDDALLARAVLHHIAANV